MPIAATLVSLHGVLVPLICASPQDWTAYCGIPPPPRVFLCRWAYQDALAEIALVERVLVNVPANMFALELGRQSCLFSGAWDIE